MLEVLFHDRARKSWSGPGGRPRRRARAKPCSRPKRRSRTYMLCRRWGKCSGTSSPRTERSSSSFGQWIPTPRPTSRQSPRASGLASRSLGNHSSGTLTVRPSSRWTTRSPSRTSTRRARGLSGAEILTPLLPEIDAMLNHNNLARPSSRVFMPTASTNSTGSSQNFA